MLQRRDIDAVGVAALLRLLELLRVAEQHQTASGGRHGQRVGQRHLPGFVDKQHVHRGRGFFAGPQPRGAAEHVHVAGSERRQRVAVVVVGAHVLGRVAGRVVLAALVPQADLLARVHGLCVHGVEQVANHLVTHGHHAHLLAGRHEGADHLRAHIGLAGAGRSLHGQGRPVEAGGQADGLLHERLARSTPPACTRSAAERVARWRVAESRGSAKQQVRAARDSVPTKHRRAQPQQRLLHGVAAHDVRLEHRRGMHIRGALALLHVDGAGRPIVRLDLAPGRRTVGEQLALPADLHVLRGIAVAVYDGAGRLTAGLVDHVAHTLDELESRDRLPLVEQFILGEVVEAVPFPVLRLVLASMPPDEMRQQPAGVVRDASARAPRPTVPPATPSAPPPAAPRARSPASAVPAA